MSGQCRADNQVKKKKKNSSPVTGPAGGIWLAQWRVSRLEEKLIISWQRMDDYAALQSKNKIMITHHSVFPARYYTGTQ